MLRAVLPCEEVRLEEVDVHGGGGIAVTAHPTRKRIGTNCSRNYIMAA